MTREKAIRLLTTKRAQPSTDYQMAEVYTMAIQALSQEPCQLLIIKSDILLHQDDRKKWMESIKREKESGVIILPPYFEPLLVPANIEINIEQEPYDDVVSRDAVLSIIDGWYEQNRDTENIEDLIILITYMDSVTQKSGKWIPVSERLPEEYGEYLITWKNPKYPKPYIGICECEITDVYDHEHNRFEVEWHFDGYITTAYPDSYVVAWMPLPEPYKGE